MKRWYIGSIEYPEYPLVEVTYDRPWRYLKLWPVVTIRTLRDEGAWLVAMIELALYQSSIWVGRGRCRDAPHTRSARRVDMALRQTMGDIPAVKFFGLREPPVIPEGPLRQREKTVGELAARAVAEVLASTVPEEVEDRERLATELREAASTYRMIWFANALKTCRLELLDYDTTMPRVLSCLAEFSERMDAADRYHVESYLVPTLHERLGSASSERAAGGERPPAVPWTCPTPLPRGMAESIGKSLALAIERALGAGAGAHEGGETILELAACCKELRAARDRDTIVTALAATFEKVKGVVYREELAPQVGGTFGPVYERLDAGTREVVDQHVLRPLFALSSRRGGPPASADWREEWRKLREPAPLAAGPMGTGPAYDDPPVVY